MAGETIRRTLFGPKFSDNRDDLRDHVACPLDDNRITYPNIFSLNLVSIMQCCALNDNSTNVYRFQVSDGGYFAGATYLALDILDYRFRFFWRKLPCHCPARRPANES
ncbi:hypothetical protein AM586_17185 [Massilia sp. WG5]|nr:hypothetical protein AM586_17185 [Massilia sp. WG5]